MLLAAWGSTGGLGVGVFFPSPRINEESSSVFPDFCILGWYNESALMEKSGGIKQEIKSIKCHRDVIGLCRDCSAKPIRCSRKYNLIVAPEPWCNWGVTGH